MFFLCTKHGLLTQAQLEVLSRGPRFVLPRSALCKEDILSEFEMYFSQVENALVESDLPRSLVGEKKERFKAKLSLMAQDYANVSRILCGFRWGEST